MLCFYLFCKKVSFPTLKHLSDMEGNKIKRKQHARTCTYTHKEKQNSAIRAAVTLFTANAAGSYSGHCHLLKDVFAMQT